MTQCRDCGQTIRMIRNRRTGNWIPCNPGQDPRGPISAVLGSNGWEGEHTTDDRPGAFRFMPHPATCDRRPKPAPKPEPPAIATDPTLF